MEKHCCDLMTSQLHDKRMPINYDKVLKEYFIYLFYSKAIQSLWYCPWCGTKLPESLRDTYCAILEKEYGIEDYWDSNILPQEFKNDEWWKKRKL